MLPKKQSTKKRRQQAAKGTPIAPGPTRHQVRALLKDAMIALSLPGTKRRRARALRRAIRRGRYSQACRKLAAFG